MTQLSSTITPLPPVLQGLRRDIDGIDDQILDLLEQRYAIVRRVGWAKGSVAGDTLSIRPTREADILARLSTRASNVPVEDVSQIWRTILTLSARQQRSYRLLLAGPETARTALSTVAARRHPAAEAEWCDDWPSALAAARSGDAVLMVLLDSAFAESTDLDLIGQHRSGCAEHPLVLELGKLHTDERPSPLWTPTSWRRMPYHQAPLYPEPRVAAQVEEELRHDVALVAAEEVSDLRAQVEQAQRGRAILLQAGECAEPIDAGRDEISAMARLIDTLARQLEADAGLPVIRLGRIGGQFAKPRSRPNDGTGLDAVPAYRGDAINGREFCPRRRTPEPRRMLIARDQARRVRDWLTSRPGPRLFTSHEALLLGYESAFTREKAGSAWASALANLAVPTSNISAGSQIPSASSVAHP